MKPIALTRAEREAVQSWRLPHPPPRGQRKMDARSLQRQGLAPAHIRRLGAMTKATFERYRHEDRHGGLAQLTQGPFPRRQSPWADSRPRMEAALRQRPPARVAAAAARIAALPGRARGPTQGRQG
jgi:hypothetical protein